MSKFRLQKLHACPGVQIEPSAYVPEIMRPNLVNARHGENVAPHTLGKPHVAPFVPHSAIRRAAACLMLCRSAEQGSAIRQIFRPHSALQIEKNGGLCERREIDHAEFVTLAVVHGKLSGLEIQIREGQGKQFGISDFRSEDQRHERIVPRPRCFLGVLRFAVGEKHLHLIVRQNHIVGALFDGRIELRVNRVFGIGNSRHKAGLFHCVEECPQLHKVLPHRGSRCAVLQQAVAVVEYVREIRVMLRLSVMGGNPSLSEPGQPVAVVFERICAFSRERGVTEIGGRRGIEFFNRSHCYTSFCFVRGSGRGFLFCPYLKLVDSRAFAISRSIASDIALRTNSACVSPVISRCFSRVSLKPFGNLKFNCSKCSL